MRITSTINLFLLLTITGFSLVFGIVGFIADDLKEAIKVAEALPKDEVVYHGQKYSNLEMAQAILDYDALVTSYGSWVQWPELGRLFISSLIFGALGGVIKTIWHLVKKQLTLSEANTLLFPFLGMLTGLLVLGLSYVIPAMLTSGLGEIRRPTLIFFCLFTGLFSEEFITNIKTRFVKVLNNKK